VTKPGSRFPVGLDRVQPSSRAPASDVLRPQRPLHEAARDAARKPVPGGAGHGLDSQAVRERMVARLRAGGIRCEPVLQAFAAVPRHRFVDTALATQAYEDTSLPIGLGQTISKPSVVARMLGLLFEGETAQSQGHLGRILEIGTGCGYQTALLARLGPRISSIERLKPLHDKATCASSTATAVPGTCRARPTTASLPRPAATTCRRRGSSSWPKAAASWRRCTMRPPVARCCSSSTSATAGCCAGNCTMPCISSP
jgi:protein-L-isoaspartate(D-aspartate) O-methyltransferase